MKEFTENQAFSPSCDLAPPSPHFPHLPSVISTGEHTGPLRKIQLADKRGGGEGGRSGGAKSYDGEKAW
jgi:hypothetical protein